MIPSKQEASRFHLNGINPAEARRVGIEPAVKERISRASRILEAVDMVFPEQVDNIAQIYDFEMQLTRYCAAHKIPFGRGITSPLIWELIQHRMASEGRQRIDGNYTEAMRDDSMRDIMNRPAAAVSCIVREMELNAQTRLPYAQERLAHNTADQIYNRSGVRLSADRAPRAGFYVPFGNGLQGYDITAPEVGEPIPGLLDHMVRKPDFSHLFVEASDLAMQRRGRRFFDTPAFTRSRDGHLVAMAYPTDCDIIYGMQFDDPELLAALTFGGLAEMQIAVREVPSINAQIYAGIHGLSADARQSLLQAA